MNTQGTQGTIENSSASMTAARAILAALPERVALPDRIKEFE